jgi:ubiquinone/menaquinone biosynthesis C-methylase UbiE
MPRSAAGSFDSTRQFYEANPDAYSEATRTRDLEGVLAGFVRGLTPGARVLDLGCGAGHDLASFKALLASPVGVDYAEPMARLAARSALVATAVANMRALPFANASFNAVWASASMHHVHRAALPAALGECRRVLGPGGTFFASIKGGSGEYVDGRGRYFALYEAATWTEALRSAGFRVDRLEQNDAPGNYDGLRRAIPWLHSFATAA